MSYFVLHVPIDKHDAHTVKKELHDYLLNCESGITVRVGSENDTPTSEELREAVKRIFISLLLALDNDQFTALH